MRHALTIIFSALALAAAGATKAGATTYTLTTIDAPGAINTYADGINKLGQVSGGYTDSTGVHGFVYTNGAFATFNVPGAADTSPHGINASGQVAGNYTNGFGQTLGFVDTNGAFATVDVPGALSTIVEAINDTGELAGYYSDATGQHSFTDTNGVFTSFDVPGAAANTTMAFGINNAGQVVGNYTDAAHTTHGFVDASGTFTTIDVPNALVVDPGGVINVNTFVLGINNSGQLAGFYIDFDGSHNFVDANGVFTAFNAPGMSPGAVRGLDTVTDDINDAGQVVGYYFDASSPSDAHGFIADPTAGTPVPEPASLLLLTAGLTGLGLIRRRQRPR